MRDVYILSEIVAEGSTDSVLRGKQCNRVIRAQKMFWEALYCPMLERFEFKNGIFVFTVAIFFCWFVNLVEYLFDKYELVLKIRTVFE